MGLDMYLTRRHYVQRWDHNPPDQQFTVTVKRGGRPYKPIDPERVTYVIEQVAYWRKANAVHAWFVANVQKGVDDCEEHYVGRKKLSELYHLVNGVLSGAVTPEHTLPTQEGFFFGGTDYDADYKQDLQDTFDQLKPIVEASADDDVGEYYYRASW